MTTTETPPINSVETAKRSYVPWALFALSAIAMLAFAGLYFLHPRRVETVRTITQPVTNTVIQTVTNNVVTEVAKEVEKIVTVTNPIPDAFIVAAMVYTNLVFASFVDSDQVLFDMRDVRVNYYLTDAVKQVVSEDEVRARFELLLRRNNVPINSQSERTLYLGLNGFFVEGASQGLLCHNINCTLTENQWLQRGTNWHRGKVTVWSKGGYYGTVGKQIANQTLLQYAEKCAEQFANDYLSANPKTK